MRGIRGRTRWFGGVNGMSVGSARAAAFRSSDLVLPLLHKLLRQVRHLLRRIRSQFATASPILLSYMI